MTSFILKTSFVAWSQRQEDGKILRDRHNCPLSRPHHPRLFPGPIRVCGASFINLSNYDQSFHSWNKLSETCWYSNSDDQARLQWIIATQSFWIALAALIETVCSCMVLLWLYRFQVAMQSPPAWSVSITNVITAAPRIRGGFTC